MHFEYTQYVRGCLVVPAFVSLFALSMLISAVSHLVLVVLKHKFSSRDGINFLLAILVCGFFLSMYIGRLLNGGIHLIYEREASAVELRGEITEITKLGRYSFPEINSGYEYADKNGVQLSINGVKCTAISRGTLEIGDRVIVTYLPQSGFVLEIYPDSVGSNYPTESASNTPDSFE